MTSTRHNLALPTLHDADAREKPIVLLIDDDQTSLILAEGPLMEAGFDILQATDGVKALEMFEQHAPDLVIVDAIMPNMDGFEVIARIRQSEMGAHIPVLMITGLDDPDSIARAYDEGATDFLIKPVNFIILPYRVQYMMRAKLTADALRASQVRLDDAQRLAQLGHWEWSPATNSASWSREAARLFALDPTESTGPWEALLAKIDIAKRQDVRSSAERAVASAAPFSIEFQVYGKRENDSRVLRLDAEPRLNNLGECIRLHGTVQDVTASNNERKEIHDLAYYDQVTGLPNRAQLRESLTHALNQSDRYDCKFALLFLDLDHFKQVNDTYGHDAGDNLLLQVSGRLSGVLRDSDVLGRPQTDDTGAKSNDRSLEDTVARIGGDEFVVLLGQISRAEDAARVAQRIAHSISQPYFIDENEVAITTSVGISVFPSDGRDSETLMKHADIAMYHAKENGRNGYQFYSRDIHDKAMLRFSLERELKLAIENDELRLVYQPKINLDSNQVVGAEALVRWNHPERGEINPAEFIPLAEETGIIHSLGQWVLNEATRQAKFWFDNNIGAFSVSVNVSPVQLTKGNIISNIDAALKQSGLAPELLEIDLTENFILDNTENGIQLLKSLKDLGIKVAIDDFGTGLTCLRDLTRLPADKIKIDRSFVDQMHIDSGDEAIVSAILTLGRNLGMAVSVEGVENEEQVAILQGYNCSEAQGFFYSRPLSAIEFEQWALDFGSDSDEPMVATG